MFYNIKDVPVFCNTYKFSKYYNFLTNRKPCICIFKKKHDRFNKNLVTQNAKKW